MAPDQYMTLLFLPVEPNDRSPLPSASRPLGGKVIAASSQNPSSCPFRSEHSGTLHCLRLLERRKLKSGRQCFHLKAWANIQIFQDVEDKSDSCVSWSSLSYAVQLTKIVATAHIHRETTHQRTTRKNTASQSIFVQENLGRSVRWTESVLQDISNKF